MKRWPLALALPLAALIVTSCNKPDDKPKLLPPYMPATNPAPIKPTAIVITPPEQPLLPETVAAIQGANEVEVKARINGYLVRQVYKDGETVAAGDVLFLLDPRTVHSQTALDDSALVRVVAPRAGVVGRASHGAGDWVDPTTVLTSVAGIDSVTVSLNLREPLSPQLEQYLNYVYQSGIAPPSEFELILPDGTVYPEKGLGYTNSPPGRTRVLQIDFSNPKHLLQPGELVKVRSIVP
jgi:hypothetical protein